MIDATYNAVFSAAMALAALVNEPVGIDADGKPAPLALPMRTVRKIKRMAKVLEPIAQMTQEEVRTTLEEAGVVQGNAVPASVRSYTETFMQTPVELSCEVLTPDDLGDGIVGARVAALLAGLGPFFVDDEETPAETLRTRANGKIETLAGMAEVGA